MKILFTVILSLLLLLPTDAQQKKPAQKPATSRTAAKPGTAKSASVKSGTAKSSSAATAKTAARKPVTGKTATNKSAANKSSANKSAAKKKTNAKGNTQVYTTAEIKGLQNQRAAIKKKIQEQERLLKENRVDIKKRLDNLLVINGEIDVRQKNIDNIQKDIAHISGNISLLETQLATLEAQLHERQAKYVESLRYMARNRSLQEKLMFVFSAQNLTQMYRRARFVREYAAYQRAQGEQVKLKQQQIAAKRQELEKEKGNKNTLLNKDKKEHAALEGKKDEQQQVVSTLQKQQKTIQAIIDDQRKKDQALNAQIDKLIAEEVAKARARAAEEARRKAAAEAAAKKRREEELARKKAAAEAAARENARRVQEAREREARAKAAAREAAKRDQAAKERAEMEARKAQAEREAAERKASVDNRRYESEVSKARNEVREANLVSSVDRKLSSNFESNKGRLPIPITGGYRIVSHYGQYNVEGLKNVTLDNKGINILGSPGAQARAIFDGEVSAVFSYGGTNGVLVRHGSYISVYCNLRSVSVTRGQKVSTRQVLGTVGADNILQFQLRRETAKLNPEVWLGR